MDLVLELSSLDRFFRATGSPRKPRGKPSPDVYIEAAHRLGSDPEETAALAPAAVEGNT
jgi:beta-phosphoglucomutase-like phosphatase (HAD superfamily)